VHNAIVHNLPEQGTVWVTTSAHPENVELTVENTGERLTPQLAATLAEPFLCGTKRIRTDHAGVGLGLALVKSFTQAVGCTNSVVVGSVPEVRMAEPR
jgi:two-component system, OmpR family, sensor histidine kinase VanS